MNIKNQLLIFLGLGIIFSIAVAKLASPLALVFLGGGAIGASLLLQARQIFDHVMGLKLRERLVPDYISGFFGLCVALALLGLYITNKSIEPVIYVISTMGVCSLLLQWYITTPVTERLIENAKTFEKEKE